MALTDETIYQLALTLPEAEEHDHLDARLFVCGQNIRDDLAL
jgi:hypothetical protein